jgi:hypothetical protein
MSSVRPQTLNTDTKFVKCPECKIVSTIVNMNNHTVYNHAQCIMCVNNKVNIILACRHAIICNICLDKLITEYAADDNQIQIESVD